MGLVEGATGNSLCGEPFSCDTSSVYGGNTLSPYSHPHVFCVTATSKTTHNRTPLTTIFICEIGNFNNGTSSSVNRIRLQTWCSNNDRAAPAKAK
jgi:hypothetical protein